MVKIIGLLCLVLLVLIPVAGSAPAFTLNDYPALVRWAGCHAQVVVDPDAPPDMTYFNSQYNIVHIGTGPLPNFPYGGTVMILLHETGHCLQFQEGKLVGYAYVIDPLTFELDADRRAADLACGLGLNGPQLLRDVFEWAHDEFGYTGDPRHGTLDERIGQGALATRCHVSQQAA